MTPVRLFSWEKCIGEDPGIVTSKTCTVWGTFFKKKMQNYKYITWHKNMHIYLGWEKKSQQFLDGWRFRSSSSQTSSQKWVHSHVLQHHLHSTPGHWSVKTHLRLLVCSLTACQHAHFSYPGQSTPCHPVLALLIDQKWLRKPRHSSADGFNKQPLTTLICQAWAPMETRLPRTEHNI